MRKTLVLTFAALFASAIPGAAATTLTGAGSTWDYPFFSKAFYEYSKAHGDVQVNYQSIGSGGGIQQFTARTVDFGATDVPMNAKELAAAESGGGGSVLQVPVVLGGVSVAYNLQGVNQLKLTPGVLADIYLGKIAKWNDPAIAKLNAGAKLPDSAIIVVHRSDGSGTTYTFTDYLSHVSPEWKTKVGASKSVSWPAPSAVGGKGNEGVAGQITNSPGAIGYVELAYVIQNHMPQAMLQNAAGKYLEASPEGVRAAAATRPDVTPTSFSIVDTKCAACYPIAGYSWVVLYANPQDKTRGKTLKDLFSWVSGDAAQKIASTLDYVPLPDNVQALAAKTLAQMKV
ncbi:MAG TPA: phosphate ABC transporter substrate-binding protein PstS [Candidatus Baltobacteraceae bacterium]|jgi:phosphate transport system substrate-binding protein|nr:phosphate ABC transporter substrate-binding protein PstS [Candidatus Baltobacteraceae bacterium]